LFELLILEEDVGGKYSSLMLKMFLSEGVVCRHPIFLASGDVAPQKFIQVRYLK